MPKKSKRVLAGCFSTVDPDLSVIFPVPALILMSALQATINAAWRVVASTHTALTPACAERASSGQVRHAWRVLIATPREMIVVRMPFVLKRVDRIPAFVCQASSAMDCRVIRPTSAHLQEANAE